MAQKSLKTLAARNTTTLNRTHLISLAVHTLYHALRLALGLRRSLLRYTLLALPAILIEVYIERSSRPKHDATSGELKRAGEDLEQKGLMEWMWDVVYWTWFCVALAAVAGDWAWWAYLAVPAYSVWLAFSTYSGVKQGMGGMMGNGGAEGAGPGAGAGGQSKRAAKMEKRGGQKMQYR